MSARRRLIELQQSDAESLRLIREATETLRRNQIEREQIEAALFRLPGPELHFDDTRRTISWQDHNIRLGRKSYLFIKTLWNDKKHRAGIERVERIVFKVGDGHRKAFLSGNTLRSFVNRLRTELQKQAFPYELKNSRKNSTQEIRGYFLKCIASTHSGDTKRIGP